MNKYKRGFTLVELLAVIVILAVLVLMAAPRVLTMMEEARSNSFKTEAGSIIDGAKLAYAQDALDGGMSDGCFKIVKGPGDTAKTVADYMDKNWAGYYGYVKIDTTGSAHKIWVTNGSYFINGGTAGSLVVVKVSDANRTLLDSFEGMSGCPAGPLS